MTFLPTKSIALGVVVVMSAYLDIFIIVLIVDLCTHVCCYCISLFVAVAFGLGVHISVFVIALFVAMATGLCDGDGVRVFVKVNANGLFEAVHVLVSVCEIVFGRWLV